MAWFNYHAKAKKLISEKKLVKVGFVNNWNGIQPAMVLFFNGEKPMPIREYRWHEYDILFNGLNKKYLKSIEFINQK